MTSIPRHELEYNAVYAALFTHDPGNAWHWTIYLHRENEDEKTHRERSGYRIHCHNKKGPWVYECASFDVSDTITLIVLAKIGAIEERDWGVEFLHELLHAIPMEIPEIDRHRESFFTCRVWFREAMRIFQRAQFFVDCPDVDALERELSSQTRLVEAQSWQVVQEPASALIVAKNARAFAQETRK